MQSRGSQSEGSCSRDVPMAVLFRRGASSSGPELTMAFATALILIVVGAEAPDSCISFSCTGIKPLVATISIGQDWRSSRSTTYGTIVIRMPCYIYRILNTLLALPGHMLPRGCVPGSPFSNRRIVSRHHATCCMERWSVRYAMRLTGRWSGSEDRVQLPMDQMFAWWNLNGHRLMKAHHTPKLCAHS